MAITDPVADMLTIIRNGIRAKKPKVDIPYISKMKTNIIRILKDQGYIKNFKIIRNKDTHRILRVTLKYQDETPVITGIKRISKPGLRKYKGYQEIPRVQNGMGIAIMSTSKGVMTDGDAREQKVGGEIICNIW